jgi:hypothetical protein
MVIVVEGNFVETPCHVKYCVTEGKTMAEAILVGIIAAASFLLGVDNST